MTAELARLDRGSQFPPVEHALREPEGLLAVGGDLSVPRLVDAYRHGIFPWYSDGQPILWWSPNPRMVLEVESFRVSHSLAKRLRAGRFELRVDTAFDAVVEACAAPRRGHAGTWITREMVDAYCALHRSGYAHSVEAWREGELAGGLYCVTLGRVIFGESMFAHETDASKVALAGLVAIARGQGVPLIDCQQETAHLASLGARPMPRRMFAARLAQLIHSIEPPGGWTPGAVSGDAAGDRRFMRTTAT